MGQLDLPDLIKPYDALLRLEHLYGTAIDAKRLIADKIRDGEIRAYANRNWISKVAKLSEARIAKPPANAAKRKQIDRNKLIGVESWTDEAPRWKWRQGVFHSVISAIPVKRRIFKGVRFVEADITLLVATAKKARQRDVSKAGAPRKGEAWDEVWLAILAVATEGPFTRHRLGQQQEMVTAVLRKFKAKDTVAPLSATVIEGTVSKIYARFFPF